MGGAELYCWGGGGCPGYVEGGREYRDLNGNTDF